MVCFLLCYLGWVVGGWWLFVGRFGCRCVGLYVGCLSGWFGSFALIGGLVCAFGLICVLGLFLLMVAV